MIRMSGNFPSLIKYMGSKTEIIPFLEYGINSIHKENQPICDLFAGSATLSGALRGQCELISNDIQQYSQVLAKAYLSNYTWEKYPSIYDLVNEAQLRYNRFNEFFPEYNNKFDYNRNFTLEEFNQIESEQRVLLENQRFQEFDDYYIFVKNYSGTYWSYDQCIWIDSIKYVADKYRGDNPELYTAIIASLMYSMAYNSQSTGHYAQYRDANNIKSMEDILIYRRREIREYFIRKFEELTTINEPNNYQYDVLSLGYLECLNTLKPGTLVYADPPYCFVHYSRFYHAIETLVRYDYPNVRYKGRYREDRHQSPFCISTQVGNAFDEMFRSVRQRELELVLSYSNSSTNTINLDDLLYRAYIELNNIVQIEQQELVRISVRELMNRINNSEESEEYQTYNLTYENAVRDNYYNIEVKLTNHSHSTMGRKDDRLRQVKEVLIVARRAD